MFRPRTSQASHEELRDVDADVTVSVPEAQAVRGDVLRLIPLTGAPRAQDLGWVNLDWSQRDELDSFPGISDRWSAYFNNQIVSTPQLFEFEPVSKFLDIDTEAGEYQFLSQYAGAGSGKTHWSDRVDNAEGWVVQFRVRGITDQTGYSPLVGHQIVFDDGVHRERCFIHQTGLFFENNPDLHVRCDMSQVREVRIAGKQDDLYVLLDNGLGIVGFDGFTGQSEGKLLGFGSTGGPTHYRTLWDYVNQYHGGAWVDGRDHVLPVYSTVGSTATTSAYAPKRRVKRFEAAYVFTLGDLGNGTTQVTVQTRNAGGAWTDFTTVTISTIGSQRIDLSGVGVAGDGTDEIRFKVFQQSTSGSGEPPRVDQITVISTFEEGGVTVIPRYGHKRGGSQHLMDLLTGADRVSRQQSPVTGLSFLARLDGDYTDEIGGPDGTPSGSAFVGGRYGQAADLGGLSATPTAWDGFGSAFSERVPFGMLDTLAEPIPGTLASLALMTGTFMLVDGEDRTTHVAQRAMTNEVGAGFEIRNLTGPGTISFLLQIMFGSVKVKHGTEEHVFTAYDYWTPRRVRIKSGVGTHDLEFTDASGGASWYVADAQSFARSTGQISFSPVTHQQGSGFAADLFVTLKDFTQGALLSRMSGNYGFEIGLAAGGYPYVRAGDGARLDELTGNWPLRVDTEYNLALSYGRFGDHTGLQVLVDGDVAGEKITTLDQVAGGAAGVTVGGSHPVKVEQVRIHADQIDAHQFSVFNGFSNPSFQSAYSAPRDASNILILRMGYKAGAHADDSGKAHHAYSRLDGRAGLDRAAVFEDRPAYLFWHGGALGVLHTSDFTQSLPQALFVRGLFYASTASRQEIYSKWNLAETVGWKVEVLETGAVKVTVKDGSTHELTSDVVLADQRRRSLYVAVTSSAITIKIDDVTKTGSFSIGSLAAATQDATIGYGLAGYVGELVLRNAILSDEDYEDWSDPTVAKWTPTDDKVFFDGEEVPNANIIHFSATRKYLSAPAGGPGNVPVHALVDGVLIGSERPFKYVHGYERALPADRIDKFVQKTHSVFRIVNEVPKGGLNIGFIQGSDISVERNVSLVDLSDHRGENLSTYFGGEFALRGMETGVGISTYADQIDTDDMKLSNRSVIRRDVKEPTPLFYRYLIGRGRRYVYQPNATSAADLSVIRDGIQILDGFGQAIPFNKYPWEIEVSTTDAYGNQLPSNVFAVTLFTSLPFLDDVSVQVRYNAVDALYGFVVESNFVEFVNPEAAMARVASGPGHDEYTLALTPTGTYDIVVGRTGV